VKNRLETANDFYSNYKKYYKEGEYTSDAEEIAEDIKTRLQEFK